jgi:outer membrane receptor protein involved in Fe transport
MGKRYKARCLSRVLHLLLAVACTLCIVVSQGEAEDQEWEQRAPQRKVEMEGILVTGAAIRDDVERPNMTTIIPSALLQGSGTTLDGALKRQPGIDVQRPQEVGGSLDDDSIKIRGFGARRIQVMMDGRTLNTPGTAGAYFIDWTTIPLTNVSEVEVVRGVSDPRYGNTLGGVVNLVTRKPQKEPEVEAQGGAGSHNTRTFHVYHSWKPGAFEYSLSGGKSESDGYLYNGNFRISNMTLHLGYDLPWKGKIIGDLQYMDVKKGFIVPNRLNTDPDSANYDVPRNRRYPASDGEIMYGGMGAYPEPGSWWKRERYNYSITYEQQLERTNLSVRGWQNHGDREAFNTRAALGRIFHKEFYDDRSFGFDGNIRYTAGLHTLLAGFDYSRLKDDGDKNLSGDFRAPFSNGNYVNSTVTGFFLMDDLATLDKKLVITPGLRYMSYDGDVGPGGRVERIKEISMDGFAPSLKLTYQYARDGLTYLSVARALRMPTPPEHYWHYDDDDAGFDTSKWSFKKEDGLMIQGGWKAVLPGKLKIEISPYYYEIRDYIHFDLSNFVCYNIDQVKIYGVEIGAARPLGRQFSLFANYSYQKSRTRGDPLVANFVAPADRGFDEIPGLPEHKFNAGIRYKGQKGEKLTLYAGIVSSQKVIYNNNTLSNTNLTVRTQRSYAVLDAEGSYPLAKNLEIIGYVRNILDENYQERYGFPAAERNFGAGVRAYY